jgi:hypothetical protein
MTASDLPSRTSSPRENEAPPPAPRPEPAFPDAASRAGALAGTALPAPLAWVGPGRTAFAGPAGGASPGRLALVGGPEDLRAVFGPGGDPEFLRSLDEYFAAGGGPCVVLNLPPIEQVPADRRAAVWLGEDGGPGYRTGLASVLDREDVGTIAAPGLRDIGMRRRLLAAIEKWDGLFLILDEIGDGAGEGPMVSDRAAVVGRRGHGPGGPPAPSGPHLAEIEASDFREDRPERALGALAGRGSHPTLGRRFPSVEAWRAWEGLRRSIDHGTRWIVFEPNGDLLRRRVEREVEAFLARLHRLGLIETGRGGEPYRVSCESTESQGRVVLRVDVRLKGPAVPPRSPRGDVRPGAGGSGSPGEGAADLHQVVRKKESTS